MTHLKCTDLFVHVQTHLAMINIHFQDVLEKSAAPTAETVIRVGRKNLCTATACMENKLGSC